MDRSIERQLTALHLRLSALLLVGALLVMAGCGGDSSERRSTTNEQDLVGKPPPGGPAGSLAQAAPAEPKGTYGEEFNTSGALAEKKDAADQTQCYSCVKLCPLDDQGVAHCDKVREDMICGWGVSANEDAAKELARAECDAALGLARDAPTYSRIEGGCPVARCR